MSSLSNVHIAGAAAIGFFVLAVLMTLLMSRHIIKGESNTPGILKTLFRGEPLSETGMRYRIGAFIAIMFAIMNTLATAFIYIAEQTIP